MENEKPAAAWPRQAFRAAATVTAIMLFDQAVFAGQFLNGWFGSLELHRENATFAGVAVVATAVAAALLRIVGRGPWWPFAAYLGLFALIGLQILIGFLKLLTLHVPLGVALIMAAAGLAVWSWRGLR